MSHFSIVIAGCLICVLISTVISFDCYDYDSEKDPEPKVISGCKACVNVTLPKSGTYPYHTHFTQGCSPDEEKNLGCRPVDDEGTLCTCNSDKCNGDGKPYPTKAPPQLRALRLRNNTAV